MIKPLLRRVKPTSGFSAALHNVFVILLPIVLLALVSQNFVSLALLVVVLSKWRMFAVAPRFWAANVRANAVDLMVGISTVLFMVNSANFFEQAVYAVLYAVWLVFVKPRSTTRFVMVQAFIGQFYGLMALYTAWGDGPGIGLTTLTGLICFLAARHFFDALGEPYSKMLSFVWGYFGAALAWLLGHWLLFYGFLPQIVLLLSALGYGFGLLYFFDQQGKLSVVLRRQFLFVMLAIIIVVLAFSDWGDKVV